MARGPPRQFSFLTATGAHTIVITASRRRNREFGCAATSGAVTEADAAGAFWPSARRPAIAITRRSRSSTRRITSPGAFAPRRSPLVGDYPIWWWRSGRIVGYALRAAGGALTHGMPGCHRPHPSCIRQGREKRAIHKSSVFTCPARCAQPPTMASSACPTRAKQLHGAGALPLMGIRGRRLQAPVPRHDAMWRSCAWPSEISRRLQARGRSLRRIPTRWPVHRPRPRSSGAPQLRAIGWLRCQRPVGAGVPGT